MVMVNGCVASRASREQADPNSNYWNELDQRLAAAGVTAKQVQTLWIKEVIPGAVGFPDIKVWRASIGRTCQFAFLWPHGEDDFAVHQSVD
jgi:hypothetical protein